MLTPNARKSLINQNMYISTCFWGKTHISLPCLLWGLICANCRLCLPVEFRVPYNFQNNFIEEPWQGSVIITWPHVHFLVAVIYWHVPTQHVHVWLYNIKLVNHTEFIYSISFVFICCQLWTLCKQNHGSWCQTLRTDFLWLTRHNCYCVTYMDMVRWVWCMTTLT